MKGSAENWFFTDHGEFHLIWTCCEVKFSKVDFSRSDSAPTGNSNAVESALFKDVITPVLSLYSDKISALFFAWLKMKQVIPEFYRHVEGMRDHSCCKRARGRRIRQGAFGAACQKRRFQPAQHGSNAMFLSCQRLFSG